MNLRKKRDCSNKGVLTHPLAKRLNFPRLSLRNSGVIASNLINHRFQSSKGKIKLST